MRRHLILAFIALIVPLLAVAFPENAYASLSSSSTASLGSLICASTGFGLLAAAICWLTGGPNIRHP
jgi:DMSO reductase anchor subunit